MPLIKKQHNALKEIAVKRKQIADSPYRLFYIGDFDYIDLWEYVENDNNRICRLVKDSQLPEIHLQTFSEIDCPDIGDCLRSADSEEELQALVDKSLADIYDNVDKWSNSIIRYLEAIDKTYNTIYSVITRSPNATSVKDLSGGLYFIGFSDRLCEITEQYDSSAIIKIVDTGKYLAYVAPEITGGYIKLSPMTYECDRIDEARQALEAHNNIDIPRKKSDILDLTECVIKTHSI